MKEPKDYKEIQAENRDRLKRAKQGVLLHESIVTVGKKRVGDTYIRSQGFNNSELDNGTSKQ